MTAGDSGLTLEKLQRVLAVTRKLAAPFDLDGILTEVVAAAKDLLNAEGATVWQFHEESAELVLRVASGLRAIHISSDRGIVGECVRTRALINVNDCHGDPRFNPDMDRISGYHTRCMLTLPLVGYDQRLVGVLQVVNRRDGVFDQADEVLAETLAAQCAVALQRMQMTERLLGAEKLRQEIAVAREVQMGTLPKAAPLVAGYDLAGFFRPTDDTGGDTYDFVPTGDGRVFLLMGDATGHGIGPALSAIQVRAMLRLAQRLGAGLDDIFRHINNQLVTDLPEDRFVTAFLGELDPVDHCLRYHSGGQGPLLHFRAVDGSCQFHPPTTFPMGALPLSSMKVPVQLPLAPGDVFALLSDGVYEFHDAQGRQFGEQGVVDVLRSHHDRPMPELLARLLAALDAFGAGAPQLDDVTVVLIRRLSNGNETPGWSVRRSFARSFDSLAAIFTFIGEALAADAASALERHAFEFTVEELFTNMVKYNASSDAHIELELEGSATELIGRICDLDSEPFDVTAAPDADVGQAAEFRRPGGLGLHLIRRLVDCIEYDYSGRRSLITFRKKRGTG